MADAHRERGRMPADRSRRGTLSVGTSAWAFAVTGVLGGFTTFSALAVELNDFADAERLPLAVLYGAVTLVAGIGATFIAHRPVEVGE